MTDVAAQMATESPAHDAVVTVMRGFVGGHVGILYRADDEGKRRHLHLADHHRLRDDESIIDAFWVEPCLDDLAISDLGASARLIARRHKDQRVPYAFNKKDAQLATDGILRLNQSLGLTCATFVLLLFEHAKISLIGIQTWEDRSAERKAEDDAAQARLVKHLQTRDPQHAALVGGEVGCTRIRAEEVAAASGMTGHPVTFLYAEPQGRRLLELVWSGEHVKPPQRPHPSEPAASPPSGPDPPST